MILDFVESCGFICCFVERDFFLGECMFDVVVDVIYWYFNLIFFVFFFNIMGMGREVLCIYFSGFVNSL